LEKKENFAIFGPACVTHCFSSEMLNSPKWEVPMNSGNTINKVISEFLKNGDKQSKLQLIEEIDWPLNKQCANYPNKLFSIVQKVKEYFNNEVESS